MSVPSEREKPVQSSSSSSHPDGRMKSITPSNNVWAAPVAARKTPAGHKALAGRTAVVWTCVMTMLVGLIAVAGQPTQAFAKEPSQQAAVSNPGESRATLTEDNEPHAVYKVDTDKKLCALTFDISWGHKTPAPVLKILKEKQINKATFFLSGPWTTHHPEIVKSIQEMGFEIGNHGYLHKDFSNHPDSWIRQQVNLSEKAIKQVTNVKTNLIRTPNGDFNPRVIKCLDSMGYTVIQWNTDSLDWKNPGASAITNRVLQRTVPGDIILMHASDSSKQITEALPQIIDGLRAKGYQFLTVTELMAQADVKTQVQ